MAKDLVEQLVGELPRERLELLGARLALASEADGDALIGRPVEEDVAAIDEDVDAPKMASRG